MPALPLWHNLGDHQELPDELGPTFEEPLLPLEEPLPEDPLPELREEDEVLDELDDPLNRWPGF